MLGKYNKFIYQILILFAFSSDLEAKEQVSDDQVKAIFIENIANHVSWPVSKRGEEKLLCVIGNDPFITYFKKLKVEIKDKNSFLDDCHVIYVSSYFHGNSKQILTKVRNSFILTISNNKNFVKLGGIVEFTIHSNKVVLKINSEALKASQLEISPGLRGMMEEF